jgi:hypothetical protein
MLDQTSLHVKNITVCTVSIVDVFLVPWMCLVSVMRAPGTLGGERVGGQVWDGEFDVCGGEGWTSRHGRMEVHLATCARGNMSE